MYIFQGLGIPNPPKRLAPPLIIFHVTSGALPIILPAVFNAVLTLLFPLRGLFLVKSNPLLD